MTTTVAAPVNAHLTLVDGAISLCSNPDCHLVLSDSEKRRSVRQRGLCTECHTNGVTVPELPAPAEETAAPEPATEAAPAEETPEETAARLHALGIDPESGEIYRCGYCDTSIAATPDAEYCGPACEKDAVRAKVRTEALAIAVGIVRFAYPEISGYEAETGLTAAVKHWSNGRVAGRGIAAAARAWIPDYADMKPAHQGIANGKVLPILKAAMRAAREYAQANLPA
ncbi:hypothetical protein DL991_41325 [Amycolatopsis sp. WAC 01375]|uniref:hypothetical protein n=1 Tax=Amycolatopsis sp. WAC 01375 TaxID=2203194 RepID=UPI000F77F30F|nr:hypothetical protein [Amycolatopsis sp. WAC 01375]RSM68712.1 hypothetical protein DL991_41325 [Amycolatopsis sp. WAC 01375]